MEFEIDQSRFLAALALAQTVADKRSTMPVLANVLLRATSDGKLVCCTTDMMIGLTESIPAKVKATGSLTVGVRHLHGVMRLSAGDLWRVAIARGGKNGVSRLLCRFIRRSL